MNFYSVLCFLLLVITILLVLKIMKMYEVMIELDFEFSKCTHEAYIKDILLSNKGDISEDVIFDILGYLVDELYVLWNSDVEKLNISKCIKLQKEIEYLTNRFWELSKEFSEYV